MPSDNRKTCQDMDVNTRYLNSKNINLNSEKADGQTRIARFRNCLSEIRSHIQSNPEVRTKTDWDLEELTCEINKLGQSSPKKPHITSDVGVIEDDLKRPENHNMKFNKKTNPPSKVSDSFPKTPGILKRTLKREHFKHGTAVEVKKIPLPGEKPPFHENKSCETSVKSSYRKVVFSESETEKFIEEKSSFQGRVILKEDSSISIMTKNPAYSSSTEEFNIGTSPVSSSESQESLCEQSSKCHETPEEVTARKVKESLYESSPGDEESTPDTQYTEDIKEDVVTREVLASNEGVNEETSHANFPSNRSYLTVKYRHHEDRIETPLSNDSMNPIYGEKSIELALSQNFRTPPPVSEGSWRTPARYRDRPPGKERRTRSSVCDPPWTYPANRVRSWNHPSESSSQEDENWMTSRNSTGVSNWRSSQEALDQKFSNDMTTANYVNDIYGTNLQVPPPQVPKFDQTRSNLLGDAQYRRSYENLPQDPNFKMTMAKAPSLDSVSIRSSESDRTSEAAFIYHLSPVYQQGQSWRQNCSTAYPQTLGYNGNFNNSSPIVPNYSHSCLPSYLPKQEADDPLEPNFRGYQLLGDSQFLRFSRQILGKYSRSNGNMRYLGLCVSGQTIQELHHIIKEKFYPVGEKIILFIGTNNFLQSQSLEEMTKAYDDLMAHLLSVSSRRLLLLTIPPIPKFAGFQSHLDKLEHFNTFIKGYGSGSESDDVIVADIGNLFLTESQKCREDCFEITYSDSHRTDLVHLNNRGLGLIRDYLVSHNLL